MRPKTLALPISAALLLTACGGEEGVGDSDALSDVELHVRDDEQPEVILPSPVDTDEGASRVLSSGDGEQVEPDNIIEFRQVAAAPESGDVLGHNFDDPVPQMAWLPFIDQTGQDIDTFVYEALTADGVTIGSDVAIYFPADEAGMHDEQLTVFRLESQYPAYARGEVQEQSGELPEIDNEVGEAPELAEHDPDAAAPEDLSSEVLIAGEGQEIDDDDQVFVQYRGWQWENGEEFDGSWTEDGQASDPFGFSLTGGVIEGWLEGIPGHNVGDRLMLVIPADQAYGESEDDEGLTEGGSPGGPLIFVIDIIQALSPEDLPEQQQQPMPDDLTDEELEELMEQLEQGEGDNESSPDAEEEQEED